MEPDQDKTRTYIVLTKGTMVSHYRIVERIGAGGMGEVYLAEDTKLNRKVALKFLPQYLASNPDVRARFIREAQTAAKLNHPNVVTIYDVGDHQGWPFFAMEYVEGRLLREVISGHDLSLGKVVALALQVCGGLEKAHQLGIVHRDIKPSNILVDAESRAKIADFGLATITGGERLTRTGSTLGTIGYMSPEQVQGEQVDARSDLFSLGVVLYEMVAGRAPFTRETEAATLRAVVEATPEPLARYKSCVPDELQRIVSRLLEKNPALRYQTAADVASELKRLLAVGKAQPVPSAKSTRTRRFVFAAVALLVVLIGVVIVFKFFPRGGKQAVDHKKMLAVLPFENLGSPEDEYFADGITDEITAKLAAIRELGVISRTSTMPYKRSTKGLREIAKELGVDYVLEGTILWDKGRDTSRVRILPQLIRVSDDTHLWAETYQRPMTDIFALQTDIATRIAEAMNITLLGPEHAALETIPTRNLDAYQAYLRGLDYWRGLDLGKENCRLAVQMFQRAVELDSTFALAYAQLAIVHAGVFQFGYDATPARLARAKAAADRALALQPNLPWAHLGLCYYYYWGLWDYDRALSELALAEAGLPNDPEILRTKAIIWRRQGKFNAAVKQLEQWFVLNPRDAGAPLEIAWTYAMLRDYALAEKFFNQSISLAPDQIVPYVGKAVNYYSWRSDTSSARATLALIPTQDNDDTRLMWFWQYVYERDYIAALDQLALLPPLPGDVQESFTPRAQLAGTVYHLMNNPERARVCFDSSRVVLEEKLKELPNDRRIHSSLGITYAGLGRKNDAIREGKLGVELLPVSKDASLGPDGVIDLALIYVMVGEYDAALDQIEYLLSIPGFFSFPYLRLDPRYDPLRNLPRYQKLLEKYGR